MSDRNRIVDGVNTAHQLALGVAIGAVIGVVPKDSAFSWIMVLILLISRGNLLCGVLAAVGLSIISPHLDGYFDPVGMFVLNHDSLQAVFTEWIKVPWMAWTRFNNTVVIGSLVCGLVAAFPLYVTARFFFNAWGIALIESVTQLPVVRMFFGEEEDGVPSDQEAVLS